MTEEERQDWLWGAEHLFDSPEPRDDEFEAMVWRYLLRWASGYNWLQPENACLNKED